jgi:hypothetical protein
MYGMSQGESGAMSLWIESWNPEQPREIPKDARGALCVRHGESLTPPAGWMIDDRRESMPRLFKPKLAVVVDKPTPTKPRRERTKAMPRPKLFDGPDDTVVVEEPVVVEERNVEAASTPPAAAVEPVVVETKPAEGVDDSKSWVPFFDPDDDLDGMLDATGPMLRDAFRSRHNGRQRD